MLALQKPKTVLGLKVRLFVLMFVQWLGCVALVSTRPEDDFELALGVFLMLGLTVLYVVLASQIYLGKNLAKAIFTYVNLGVVAFALYLSVFSELLRGFIRNSATIGPPIESANPRLALATNVFTPENLWPTLLVLFCAALILNILRRHTLLKLWDRSVIGTREHRDSRLSLGNTLVLAVFLWLCFYALLIVLPSHIDFLNDFKTLFFGQHVIYYVLMLVFWWAIALVIGEYLVTREELKNLRQIRTLFENVSFNQIRSPEAAALLAQVEEVFRPVTRSAVVYRIHSLLKSILDGKSSELEETLQRIEGIEFQTTENARSFINTLLGSLPLLGFMGTVMGIIAAVGGFSEVIAEGGETTQLTSSLEGMSFAFETTLLGLIGSLLGSYIFALVRRYDDQLDVALAQFCHEQIISKVTRSTQ